jgi:hypothetical protein
MNINNYINNIDLFYYKLNQAIDRIKDITPNDINWRYDLAHNTDIICMTCVELEVYSRALRDKLNEPKIL